jgi:hypothetical protein
MVTSFLRLSVIARDTRITCWEWATMFGSIEYLAMSSSHSSREGILSVKDKGPIAILDLPQILAPHVKLEFSSILIIPD